MSQLEYGKTDRMADKFIYAVSVDHEGPGSEHRLSSMWTPQQSVDVTVLMQQYTWTIHRRHTISLTRESRRPIRWSGNYELYPRCASFAGGGEGFGSQGAA